MKLAERPSLGSLPQVRALFERALEWLLAQIGAERVALLYGDDERADPKVRAVHGLGAEDFWKDAPLSLTLLRQVRETGQPLWLPDVPSDPNFKDHLSLLLADVSSLICVPFWGPAGTLAGLLYADTKKVRLTRDHLQQTLRLARCLEDQLRCVVEGRPLPPLPDEGPVPQAAPRAAAAPAPKRAPALPPEEEPYATRAPKRFAAPSAPVQASFFRCLATMLGAGVPIAQALWMLGLGAEEPAMAQVLQELSRRVRRGQMLSTALEAVAVFPVFLVKLVALGERSGTLSTMLAEGAAYQERTLANRMKLQSALIYPAFVLVASLILLVVGPGYLLSGQFRLLTDLRVQLPAVTVALAQVSTWLVKPVVWVPLAALGWLAWRRWRGAVGPLLWRLPVLRRLGRAWGTAQFARCLAVQLKGGLGMVPALQDAGGVVDHPTLRVRLPEAVEAIHNGADLRTSLAILDFFPRSFLEMVTAGEEVGRLDEMLEFLARLHEEQAEYELEVLTSLIEPLLMMGLGTLTALIMLATMLPTVRLLENL